MSVITQEYDIDLKATGEYPVVKMSQFDTGSRTIVFTVYDGHDLAQIGGMVARVDGTRSDGVEFSSTCTVSAGSKVSFTISQEMTKYAGKHAAELVIFDASGNPAGTQNFIIEVEPAPMVRDAAASADDRTLYDQFTGSVSNVVSGKMASVSNVVSDKMALVDTKMANIDNQITNTVDKKIDSRITPDPLLGAWCACTVTSDVTLKGDGKAHYIPLKIQSKSDGAENVFSVGTVADAVTFKKPGVYHLMLDGFYNGSSTGPAARYTSVDLSAAEGTGSRTNERRWTLCSSQGIGAEGAKSQVFRGGVTFYVPDDGKTHILSISTVGSSDVVLAANSSPQIILTLVSSGSNIVEITGVLPDGMPVYAGSSKAGGTTVEYYTVHKA